MLLAIASGRRKLDFPIPIDVRGAKTTHDCLTFQRGDGYFSGPPFNTLLYKLGHEQLWTLLGQVYQHGAHNANNITLILGHEKRALEESYPTGFPNFASGGVSLLGGLLNVPKQTPLPRRQPLRGGHAVVVHCQMPSCNPLKHPLVGLNVN